jgi:hypothetical protein
MGRAAGQVESTDGFYPASGTPRPHRWNIRARPPRHNREASQEEEAMMMIGIVLAVITIVTALYG